jgi:hypothetical protein
MARTFEWRKQWVVALGDEGPVAEDAAASKGARDGLSGLGVAARGAAQRESGGSSMFSTSEASGTVEVDENVDDNLDNMSSVSSPAAGLKAAAAAAAAAAGFAPPPAASAAPQAAVSASVHRHNAELVFGEILEWLLDTTLTATAPLGEDLGLGGAVPASARLYRLLDEGEPLVALLRRSGLLASEAHARALKALPRDGAARAQASMRLFGERCRELGLPQQFCLVPGDRSSRRIAGCFMLLSRLCRASNNRDVRRLDVSAKALAAIGLRPDEMLIGRPHPLLQDMQLKGAFWVPDSFSSTCLLCERHFGLWTRRHHCRSCGTLCCASCSPARERCLGFPHDKRQRICVTCAQARTMPAPQPE